MRRSLVWILCLLVPIPCLALGIGGGLWIETLDLTNAKAFVLQTAQDLDAPPEVTDELNALLAGIPDLAPFPMLGALISAPAGVGAVEFEAAMLTERMLHLTEVWPPGGMTFTDPPLSVNFALTAYRFSASWRPRIDLGLVAVAGGAGFAFSAGSLNPALSSPDPDVQAIIDLWPLEGISWSAGGAMLGADLELGLPFLRLFLRGGLTLPIFQSPGVWGLRVGSYYAAVGLVIRF